MASYPTEAWKQLSPEDKAFMREIKRVFNNIKYEGETFSPGVLVFPEREFNRRAYWLSES
jgi:hypothetical protein